MKNEMISRDKAAFVIAAFGMAAAVFISIFADHQPSHLQSSFTFILLLILAAHLILAKAVADHRPWARVAGIIWGGFFLFGPLGPVGAYVIWCLMKEQAKEKAETPFRPLTQEQLAGYAMVMDMAGGRSNI
jgi:hypothetical protein